MIGTASQPKAGRQAGGGKRARENRDKLTVDHLKDTPIADETLGELVPARDDVALVCAFRHGLVRLIRSTRRVDIVPPGVVGIDGAGAAVIVRAVERVHIEAALGDRPALGVREVVGVADEVLEVALCVVGYFGEGGSFRVVQVS